MQLARLQALLILLWLASALAMVGVYFYVSPVLAWMGGSALVLGPSLVLGLEFWALHRFGRTPRVPNASAAQLWRAWAGELWAAWLTFCWHQPFFSRRYADQLGPEHGGLRGVVLVHGYMCNRGIWNGWMKVLAQQGRPFMALNLAPVFGEIDPHAAAIEEAITRMTRATGLAPLVVGHSMGGLVLRAWLRQARAPERVHRLVSLGTPHRGTWLAQWGHTRNAKQMRIGSLWLEALVQDSPRDWHRHWACFYSNADNIVFPACHAMLEGADNRLLPGLAHVQMVHTPAVMAAVLALLEVPPWAELGTPLQDRAD